MVEEGKQTVKIELHIPLDLFNQIEECRQKNKEAFNLELKAKSNTIESFVIYLIEMGISEYG